MIDVVLAPREYFSLGPLLITDANLGGLITTAIIVLLVAFSFSTFKLVPTRLQVMVEGAVNALYSRLTAAFGNETQARKFLPLFVTLLFFIFVANQLTVLPLMFDILWGDAALIRQPTSDLSGTIMLALIVVITANILALATSPWGHLRSFFPIDNFLSVRTLPQFFNASIELAIGLLNIVGEFSKIISLSCRLFGNVFAGNVIVLVLAGMTVVTGYVLPIPFIFLSIFSGVVQAYVFTALAMEFTLGPIISARQYAQQRKS